MRLAPVALTLAMGWGGVAAAQSPFEAFEAICVKSAGNRSAAIAEAERLGWGVSPPELKEGLRDFYGPGSDSEARVAKSSDGIRLLTVGRTVMRPLGDTVTMEMCTVVASQTDAGAIRAAAAKLAQVPRAAFLEGDGDVAYAWREESGSHLNLPKSDLVRHHDNPNVRMLVVSTSGAMSSILMAVPAQTAK